MVPCQMVSLSVIVPRFTVKWCHCQSKFNGSQLDVAKVTYSQLDCATVNYSSMVHCQLAPLVVLVPWFTVRRRHCLSYFRGHCQMVPPLVIVPSFTVRWCHCQSLLVISEAHCLLAPLLVIVPWFTLSWRHCHSKFQGSLLDCTTVIYSSVILCWMAPLSVILPRFTVRCHHCQSQFHGSLLDVTTISHSSFTVRWHHCLLQSMVHCQMAPLSVIVQWYTIRCCHCHSQCIGSLSYGATISHSSFFP